MSATRRGVVCTGHLGNASRGRTERVAARPQAVGHGGIVGARPSGSHAGQTSNRHHAPNIIGGDLVLLGGGGGGALASMRPLLMQPCGTSHRARAR